MLLHMQDTARGIKSKHEENCNTVHYSYYT
jgi:hypothetical protein